ncbi:MAG: hypothetical protein H6713_17315 [Myxococcales bacterium]|nr:hypothetical protein [Myxococcales bacterium]
MHRRVALAVTLACPALTACGETLASGWKIQTRAQLSRGDCDGGFVVRGHDGALQVVDDVHDAIGVSREALDAYVFAAKPWRGGWLVSTNACEGELCRTSPSYRVDARGVATALENSAATTYAPLPDGELLVVKRRCSYHRMGIVVTTLGRARAPEEEPQVIGGPWPGLCARAVAVDEGGRPWLLASVAGLDDMYNVVLRVNDDGAPRIVHHVQGLHGDAELVRQAYTQLEIEGEQLYLSSSLDGAPPLRLVPGPHGFEQQHVRPPSCRLRRLPRRSRPPPPPAGELSFAAIARLESAGVRVYERARELGIVPYHRALNEVVALIAELVPADGYTLILHEEPPEGLAALGRLPPGFYATFSSDAARREALHRRFPQLRPPSR